MTDPTSRQRGRYKKTRQQISENSFLSEGCFLKFAVLSFCGALSDERSQKDKTANFCPKVVF
jgi:hypothetical protein